MRFLPVLLGVVSCATASHPAGLAPVSLRRVAMRDQTPSDSTANPLILLSPGRSALGLTITIENFCDFKIRAGRRTTADTLDIGLVFESAELASAFRDQTIREATSCTGPGEIQHLITYSGHITDIRPKAYTVRIWIGGQVFYQEQIVIAAS